MVKLKSIWCWYCF